MKRLVLFGGSGLVGRSLQTALAAHGGFAVAAPLRRQADIGDAAAIERVFCRFRPHIVINAAAYTDVDKAQCERTAAEAANAKGVRHLAAAAARHGAFLIHLSTDYVFDGGQSRPYRENDAAAPLNVYGASKLAGEQAVLDYPRGLVLRTSWVFGRHGRNFVRTVLQLAHSGRPLRFAADQTGTPTAAADLAAALVRLSERLPTEGNAPCGLFHYAGAPAVSRCDFARAVLSEAVRQQLLPDMPDIAAVPAADFQTAAVRPANSALDSRRLQTAYGIEPSDWRRALQDLRPYWNDAVCSTKEKTCISLIPPCPM